jgi:hypothetical protein
VINVAQGSFPSLRQALLGHGISQADIDELKGALDAEPTPPTGRLGPRVAGWMGKMVTKAAEGTWGVTVGVAGDLLAKALGKYYGLS